MSNRTTLSRRTLLRGFGVGSGICLGLPILDSMLTTNGELIRAARGQNGLPLNFLTFFLPNGIFEDAFWPNDTGADYTLSRNLQPLADFKADFTLIQGLSKQEAFRNQDVDSDVHQRGHASFATGGSLASAQTVEFPSVDQLIAAQPANTARFNSLPVALGGVTGGQADHISWRSGSTPVPADRDPAKLFERLFGAPVGGPAVDYSQSVLDYLLDDITKLKMEIPHTDKGRLDEYLESIRQLEQEIQPIGTSCNQSDPIDARLGGESPPIDDNNGRYSNDRARLLLQLQVTAISCGFTQVGSFMLASRPNKRQFRWIGHEDGEDGHHGISHLTTAAGREAQAQIVTDELEQFAHLLRLMKGVTQGGNTLLYNSVIFFANECGMGDYHDFMNIPVILAGNGGGALSPGRHVRYPEDSRYSNLMVTLLNLMGVSTSTFGANGRAPLSGLV